jgi:hypothetical protein
MAAGRVGVVKSFSSLVIGRGEKPCGRMERKKPHCMNCRMHHKMGAPGEAEEARSTNCAYHTGCATYWIDCGPLSPPPEREISLHIDKPPLLSSSFPFPASVLIAAREKEVFMAE